MDKLLVRRKGHKRRAYTRRDGVRVKASRVEASTFKIHDRGARGRTPKSRRWYKPGVRTGWRKNMLAGDRRQLVLAAHGGDLLASARAMQALANVTTDRRTSLLAGRDARFFWRYGGRGVTKNRG